MKIVKLRTVKKNWERIERCTWLLLKVKINLATRHLCETKTWGRGVLRLLSGTACSYVWVCLCACVCWDSPQEVPDSPKSISGAHGRAKELSDTDRCCGGSLVRTCAAFIIILLHFKHFYSSEAGLCSLHSYTGKIRQKSGLLLFLRFEFKYWERDLCWHLLVQSGYYNSTRNKGSHTRPDTINSLRLG